jgi:hypothetical protein
MVKVHGPMMSLDASGTLANAVTYSKWKGRNYVRERVIPSNPKTGPQVGRRAMFTFLSQYWQYLGAADKATWQDVADELVALTFNAYVSKNMEGWHNFLSPGYLWPIDRNDTAGTVGPDLTATWEENRILFTVDINTLNQNWGVIIHASLTTGFDTAVSNAIIVIPATAVQQFTAYWTPPSVTTWYARCRCFSLEGVLGIENVETSAVP